jgi:hypothetical protein
MRNVLRALIVLVLSTAPAFANVMVTSPSNGETVTSEATFIATSNTTTCERGVASMGIYVDNRLMYVVDGAKLNTTLSLAPGTHNTAIQEWDYCGGATKTFVTVSAEPKTGVWVTSPANNSTVSWLTNYVATATTSCPKGVAAMGIYVNNQLVYQVNGSKLNTQMNLRPGNQHTVVEEWDNCGGAATAPVNVTVQGSGNTFYNLQSSKGWNSWGQLAPSYSDCNNPCSGVNWSMEQGLNAPSLSGSAAKFTLGGKTPYSDVLWENPVIGQFSTQGLPDLDQKLVPSLHNFTYDAYFYLDNPKVTQAMEFDVNWFQNSVGMTWGTECRIEGGNEWDIWDNVNAKWVPTGVPCNPLSNGWNHVTLNVQRGPNNTVVYQSITLNGFTANLNKSYAPFTVPPSWYGITVNFQMDGDRGQKAFTSYLDNFSFMYW